jgi:hypothetical protein
VTGGYLVVRRDGVLWGLPAERVSAIERVERPAVPRPEPGEALGASPPGAPGRPALAFEVRFAGGDRFGVEAVLTLAADLAIHPVSARLRRFLPAESAGLSLFAGEPLLLLGSTALAPKAAGAAKAAHG